MQDFSAYCAEESTVETIKTDDEWSKYDYSDDEISTVEPKCSAKKTVQNMQANVFSLVTQVSAVAATFQQQGWEDQLLEDKAFAYNHLGHTIGQIFE